MGFDRSYFYYPMQHTEVFSRLCRQMIALLHCLQFLENINEMHT
ncbi:hypothetical protein M5D96_010662, partial [Drosophila gunungcola]